MKRVKITYGDWSAEVEYDPTKAVLARMEQHLLEWPGEEGADSSKDKDITDIFLCRLALDSYKLSVAGYTLKQIRAALSAQRYWFALDGRYGIKLKSVEKYEFQLDLFSTQETYIDSTSVVLNQSSAEVSPLPLVVASPTEGDTA